MSVPCTKVIKDSLLSSFRGYVINCSEVNNIDTFQFINENQGLAKYLQNRQTQ